MAPIIFLVYFKNTAKLRKVCRKTMFYNIKISDGLIIPPFKKTGTAYYTDRILEKKESPSPCEGGRSWLRSQNPELLCCGSLCCGSLALLAAAAASLLLGCLNLIVCGVVVDELDEASLGVVAEAVAGLEDACVAAGTVTDLLSNVVEELRNGILVLQVAEHETAVGHGILFAAVDQGLSVYAQRLCLGKGGEDALVHDQ